MEKSLIELICENFMFLFGSLFLYIIKYIRAENITYMDYLAIITSFVSTGLVIF